MPASNTDGATLAYLYDTSGNLVEVDKPGNDSAGSVTPPPDRTDWPKGDVPETYAYGAGSSAMKAACGPRCTVAMWKKPNNLKDGSALRFAYTGSLQLSSWAVQGVMNFRYRRHKYGNAAGSLDGVRDVVHGGLCLSAGIGVQHLRRLGDDDDVRFGRARDDLKSTEKQRTQTRHWTGTAEGVWLVTKAGWTQTT